MKILGFLKSIPTLVKLWFPRLIWGCLLLFAGGISLSIYVSYLPFTEAKQVTATEAQATVKKRSISTPAQTHPQKADIIPSDPEVIAWKKYSQSIPTQQENKPKISIIITNLGLNPYISQHAITQLPKEITLAFTPESPNLQTMLDTARENQHEVLLHVGMEPMDLKTHDPGPNPLLTGTSSETNISRLQKHLNKASGYVGITNFQGSRFLAVKGTLDPIIKELKKKGLIFVEGPKQTRSLAEDVTNHFKVPFGRSIKYIDAVLAKEMIDQELDSLVEIAQKQGHVIAIGRPSLLTLERVANWTREAGKKGVAIVPVTAITKQSIRKE